MKLNVVERLMSIQLLNDYKEGNFITFKIIKGLRQKLFINEEEANEFEMKVVDNRYTWNAKGAEPKEIELSEGEISLLKEPLVKMNKENKLIADYVILYELFVASEQEQKT